MNLILVEQSECSETADGHLQVHLSPKDRRSIHIKTVLKLVAHDTARVGIIGGDMFDSEVIIDEGYRLILRKENIRMVSERVDEDISIILAFPRPKGLGRMFPVFSQQGVRSIRVCNAARVEKSYWGSHIINHSYYNPALLKGLEQANVSTRLPDLSFDPRPFDKFLEDADIEFPREQFIRLLCHPHDASPLTDTLIETCRERREQGLGCEVVVAIGPEGGWLDFELALLIEKYHFACVSFSPRILSTDVAVTSVVAIISDALRRT